MKTILHLVDDQKPGGVQRLLAHLAADDTLGRIARHEVVAVRKGAWRPPIQPADAVVSHLSICWRNFPLFAALRAAYATAPMIHVEHSYSEAFMAHNVRRTERFRALLMGAYSLFDKVVGVSDAQTRWLRDTGLAPERKLSAIPSCVNLDRFLSLAPKGRDSRMALGAIGRLDRQKGFDTLICAMRKVDPNLATLDIWGDGPERAALTRLADELPHVTLRGHVDDPVEAYIAADAIIVPSRWEPFGLVALEARAAARPILVAAVDGLPEQARDGGIVTLEGADQSLWASSIQDLCSIDITEMQDAARFSASNAEDIFVAGWRRLAEEVFASGFPKERSAA